MTRKWLIVSVLLLAILLVWFYRKEKTTKQANANLQAAAVPVKEALWSAPDSNSIPGNEQGELIRYGKKLIRHTALYLGPSGSVSRISNGRCQNCHRKPEQKSLGGKLEV
jgi:thiosulfate dehydrogenase